MTTEEYAEYLSEHWCRNQKRVGKIRKLYMQRRWREQRLRRVSRTQKEQV